MFRTICRYAGAILAIGAIIIGAFGFISGHIRTGCIEMGAALLLLGEITVDKDRKRYKTIIVALAVLALLVDAFFRFVLIRG